MSEPSVSVVIPAYRAAHTIGRAVRSLLDQTRRPDEIVVVDDGSPDDLEAALEPHRAHVRLVRQANCGAASARNAGIELARGDLIAFLDADDFWHPGKLARQLEVLERHPEVGLVSTRFFIQLPGRAAKELDIKGPCHYDRVVTAAGPEVMAVARKTSTPTVIVRRVALAGHRFDEGLGTAEDVDLWIRLVASGPVYLLSEILVTVVLEPGSLSRSDVAGDHANMLSVLRRHGGLLGRAGVQAWRAMVYRDWAASHLGNGEPQAALWPAWNRVWNQPWSPQGWWILFKSATWTCACSLTGRKPRAPVGLT